MVVVTRAGSAQTRHVHHSFCALCEIETPATYRGCFGRQLTLVGERLTFKRYNTHRRVGLSSRLFRPRWQV